MSCSFIVSAFVLSIAVGFAGKLKEADLFGVWSTSCENVLENGLRYNYSATETLRSDGSFEVASEFRTYLPGHDRPVTYGTSLDKGRWHIEEGQLFKRYTSVEVEKYASDIPAMDRERYERELNRLIQQPFLYQPRSVSSDRVVVYEQASKAVYTMDRID